MIATRRQLVLGVGLIALALRGLYLWEISSAPFFDLRLGDAEAYHVWARSIAGGNWIGSGVFYQAPLYPYFLAAIYRVLGDSTLAVRIVQAITGACSCALVASAGMSVFGRVGAAAGLLLAFYPVAIYFDGLLEKSSLVIFFTTALLVLLAIPPERSSVRRWVAAGAVLGLLVLTRENALLLVAVVLLWIWIGLWREKAYTRRASMATAAFVAGAAMVLLPVGLRNRIAGGEFHLTTSQLGPNFYIGNHAGATGTYEALVPGHGSAADEREDATQLAERAVGRRLGPAEVSSFWTRRAADDMRAEPGDWLRLIGRKVALTFNTTEIADTESRDVYAESSFLLRVLRPFGFSVVLGITALAAVLTVQSWRRLWILYAIAGTYAASVTMFYVLERYRIAMVPVLMVLAAGAFDRAVWRQSKPRIAVALGVAMLAVSLSHLPLAEERAARSTHYIAIASALSNDPSRHEEAMQFYTRALAETPNSPAALFGAGTALMKAGRAGEAVSRLRAAVASRADYAEARYNLGLALAAAGRSQEAVDEYRAALRLRPDDPDVQLALAKAFLALDQSEMARRQYEQALGTHPNSVPALAGLGVALARTGRTDEALGALRRALALDPNDADVHNNLGFTLASSGQLAEAIPHFERALALNPGDENARRNLDRARDLLRR